MPSRTYHLIGPDGAEYQSATKGTLGGHRRSKVYGRLDCPGAARALARGGPYAKYRVFFADEATAIKAGYRPCWLCMRAEYAAWKRGLRKEVLGPTAVGGLMAGAAIVRAPSRIDDSHEPAPR